jgi:hypothetical protein
MPALRAEMEAMQAVTLHCRIFLTWAKEKMPLVMPSSTI